MQNYYLLLKNLLPHGAFWEIQRGSAIDRLLQGLSLEFERVKELANSLPNLIESKPRLKRLLGLSPTRIEAIPSLLNRNGSLSRQYIENRLNALGYIDFKIHDPTEDDLGLEPIIDPKNVGIVFVKLHVDKIVYLLVGNPCGQPLREWRNTLFETEIKKLMPAHVTARFLYQPKEASNATSR